ncbi:MAG TPA: M23 family metallopeptidase [Gemmatimonadaceae bacterium]|nr:M23 family metallopeptidase [Gemmatimonadaceae bacterium]
MACAAGRPALTRRASLMVAASLLVAGCRMGHAPSPSPARASAARVALPAGVSKDDYEYLRQRHILIPVANTKLARIPDSFDDARDGRRRHHAVDIMAPRGTPVLAADGGRVLKLRKGGAGGITIYAVDPKSRFVYYYAHLDRYRKGISEGQSLERGDTIGFVGTSGNAPPDVPHLHFQVMRMPEDGKWWTGIPVNPRPLFVE